MAIKETDTVNLATYNYDDLSRRTTVTLGNGSTTTYAYDTQAALASISHDLAGTAQDVAYTYTRNEAQQITNQAWSNDTYQWTGATNGTKNYTANGLNEYTTVAGNTLGYDANGNLTGDGVWTYTYDAANRLTSTNKTGTSANFAYDPLGRLRTTTLNGVATQLFYDGSDLVAEYDSGATTLLRRYVHGPGIDEPIVAYEGAGTANKSWLYADHLGSVIATADAAGNSTSTLSYGPYGEPNQSTGVRFRYTGQQFIGPLNLYYYKARFYSPALGRFLQTDPIGYEDDMNLYAYVGNDPVNANDPSGRCPWCVGAVIGFGVDFVAQAYIHHNQGKSILGSYDIGQGLAAAGAGALTAGASAFIGGAIEGGGALAIGARAVANAGVGAAVTVGQTAVLNNLDNHNDSYVKSLEVGAAFGAAGSAVGDALTSGIQSLAQSAAGLSAGEKNFILNFQELNNIKPAPAGVATGQAVGAVVGSGSSFVPLDSETTPKK